MLYVHHIFICLFKTSSISIVTFLAFVRYLLNSFVELFFLKFIETFCLLKEYNILLMWKFEIAERINEKISWIFSMFHIYIVLIFAFKLSWVWQFNFINIYFIYFLLHCWLQLLNYIYYFLVCVIYYFAILINFPSFRCFYSNV